MTELFEILRYSSSPDAQVSIPSITAAKTSDVAIALWFT